VASTNRRHHANGKSGGHKQSLIQEWKEALLMVVWWYFKVKLLY